MTGTNVIKLFTSVIYECSQKARLLVPGKPSLMFVGKAMSASGLTHKHSTRLVRFAREKHSSLLGTFVNYRRKKFFNL